MSQDTRCGPAKRLAPAIAQDRMCAHAFVEDDGLYLEIDCSECGGPQDLGNGRCVTSLLNILRNGARPEAVVLKRFIHIRYRRIALAHIFDLADELANLARLASEEKLSDERCQTCPASMPKAASALIRLLRADPLSYKDSACALSSKTEEEASTHCARARSCALRVTAMSAYLRGAGESA